MIRDHDPIAMLAHPRVRVLGPVATAAYLALLQSATPSGHVADADLERVLALSGRPAIAALTASELLGEEPSAPGYWIVQPETLDRAAHFPTQAEQWAADTREVTAQFGERIGTVSAREWGDAMDAIANERGKQ